VKQSKKVENDISSILLKFFVGCPVKYKRRKQKGQITETAWCKGKPGSIFGTCRYDLIPKVKKKNSIQFNSIYLNTVKFIRNRAQYTDAICILVSFQGTPTWQPGINENIWNSLLL